MRWAEIPRVRIGLKAWMTEEIVLFDDHFMMQAAVKIYRDGDV